MSKIVFIPSYVEQGVSMLNQAKQILAEIPAEVQAGIATISGTNYQGGIPTFDTGESASAEVSSLGSKIDYITHEIERYSSGNYIFQDGDLVILDPNDKDMIGRLRLKDNQIMALQVYENQRIVASWQHMGAKFLEGAVESVGSIIDGFASAVSLVTWGSWDDAIEGFVQKDFASSMFDSLYAEGGAWEEMAKMSKADEWRPLGFLEGAPLIGGLANASAASLAEGFGSAVPYMAAGMAMAPVASAGAASFASSALGKAAVKVAINVAADAALGSLGGLGRGTNEGMDEGMTMQQAMATKGLQEVKQEVKMSVTAGLFGEVLGEGVEILQNRGVRNALNEAAEVASKNALTGLDNATLKAAGQVDDTLGLAARNVDSVDALAKNMGEANFAKLTTNPDDISKAVQDAAQKAGVDITDVKAVDDFAAKYAKDEIASNVENVYRKQADQLFDDDVAKKLADNATSVRNANMSPSQLQDAANKSIVDDVMAKSKGNVTPEGMAEISQRQLKMQSASDFEMRNEIINNNANKIKMDAESGRVQFQNDYVAQNKVAIEDTVKYATNNPDEMVKLGREAIAEKAAGSVEKQIADAKASLLRQPGMVTAADDAMGQAVKNKLTDGLATNLSDKAGKKFDKLFGGSKALDNATANASTAMENAIRDAAAQGKKLSISEIQDIGKKAATNSIKYDALTTGNKAAKNALSEIDNDFAKDMRNVKKGKETLASVKDKYAPEVSNIKASQATGNPKGLSTSAAQAAGGNPKGVSTNAGQQAIGGNPKGVSADAGQQAIGGNPKGVSTDAGQQMGTNSNSPVVRESVDSKGTKIKETLDSDGNVINKESQWENGRRVENEKGISAEVKDKDSVARYEAQTKDGIHQEKGVDNNGYNFDSKKSKDGSSIDIRSKEGEPTVKTVSDSQGRTLKETISDDARRLEASDGKGTTRDTIIKDGKTDDIIRYDDGSSVRTISENDKPVSITTETPSGKMEETIRYDQNGNVSGRDIEVTSPDGSVKQSISIDESGNRYEITEDLNNNSRVIKETPADGPTVTKYEDASGTVNKTVTTEDLGNGQTRVTTDTVDGSYVETIDSVNNTRNIEVTGADGTRQSIEFDSNGNRYEVTEYADNTRKIVDTPKDAPPVTRYEDAAGNAIDPDSFTKPNMPETPTTVLDETTVYKHDYTKITEGTGPNGEKIITTTELDSGYRSIEYPDGGVKIETLDANGNVIDATYTAGNHDLKLGVFGTSAADSGMSFSEALSAVRKGTPGSDDYLEGLATLANKYGTGDGGLALRTDLSSSLANAQNNAAYYARQFDLTGDTRYYNAFQEQLAEIGGYGDEFNDMIADQAEAYAKAKNGLDLPDCMKNNTSPYDLIDGKPKADIDSPLDSIKGDIDGKPKPDLDPDVKDLEGRNPIDEINEGGKPKTGDNGTNPNPTDNGTNPNPTDNGKNPNPTDNGKNPNPADNGTNPKPDNTGADPNNKKLPPSNNPNLDQNTKTTNKIKDNFGRETTIDEVHGKGPNGEDIVEKTVTGPKGDQTRTTVTTKTDVDPNDATKSTTTKTTKYETVDADGNVTYKEKIETVENKYQADGKTLKEQKVTTEYPERRIETKNSDGTVNSKKIGNSTTTKEIEYSKNAKGNDVITTKSTTDGKTRTKVDEVSTVKTPDGKTATRTDTKITADGKDTLITRTQVDEHNFTTRTVTPDGKIKTIESSTLENGNVSRKITTREDLKKNIKTTKYEDYDLSNNTKTTAVIDQKGKIKVTVDEVDLSTGLKSAWDETASSRNFAQKWYSNRSGNFKTDVRDAFGETWITRRERMKYVKDEAGGLLHPFKRRNAYVARGREELAQIYAEQMAKKNGGVITDEIMEAATKKANNKWNFFQTAKAKQLGKEAIFDEGVARGLREVVEEAHSEGGEALLKKAAAKEAVARAAAAAVGVPLIYNMVTGGGDETVPTLPPVADTTAPPITTPTPTPGPGPGPSPSPGPGTDGDDGGTTEPTDTITDPSAVDPNETPTDTMTPTEPTDNIFEEEIIAGVTDNNPSGEQDTGGNNGGGGYWGPSGGGQSFDDTITEEILGDGITDEDALLGDEDLEGLEDEDDIYTIPLASGNSSTSKVTKDGINPIPILAGLGLVAAAGVGAKIYMDNKKNNENGDDDEFMDDSEFEDFSSKDSDLIADEWTGEETMNENTDEGLDYERPSFYSDTLGDEI